MHEQFERILRPHARSEFIGAEDLSVFKLEGEKLGVRTIVVKKEGQECLVDAVDDLGRPFSIPSIVPEGEILVNFYARSEGKLDALYCRIKELKRASTYPFI